MDETCSMHEVDEIRIQHFSRKNLKRGGHLGDLDANGRTILKRTLLK
jgi:hypothetical protein